MPSARDIALRTLTRQLERYPTMPAIETAPPQAPRSDPRDARLARAIHRETLRRLLTLEHLLSPLLRRPMRKMEPKMQAILLTGSAQLLFFEKLPPHAVVNEMVELGKRRLRKGAGKMANAVLRKMAGLIAERRAEGEWSPARDALPWRSGAIRLHQPLLPDPADFVAHMSAATSHPRALVDAWTKAWGEARTRELLLHGLTEPPTVVHPAPEDALDAADPPLIPHRQSRFALWEGDHAHLMRYLAQNPRRWVQDPTAAKPVAATRSLSPLRIVDYCAGRGTKTRQLAELHPRSSMACTEVHTRRLADLREAFQERPHVKVIEADRVRERVERADLLVLDVPCSNTGVLARRLEARYRFSRRDVRELVELQRRIILQAAPMLRSNSPNGENAAEEEGGRILYSTCSLELEENGQQARWIAEKLNMRIEKEELTFPGGARTTYHDGGYYALLGP